MYLKKSKFKGDFIMKSEKLVIHFKGKDDIDLETLSISLNETVDTLKILADELISENDFCKFKVLNIQRGSFVITINQIMELAPVIIPAIPTVIESYKEILKIRKFLNGEPPKEIIKNENTTTIKNKHGDIYHADTMTVNIYNNEIEKSMANMAKVVLNDKERTGITYDFTNDKGDKESIELNRENLSYLSMPQDIENFDNGIEEDETITWVKVNKPDLNGKSQWGVSLFGKSIKCIISDQEFLNKVHNDEIPFISNTKLYVKMIVRYKSNAVDNKSEIISRNVIKVFEVKNED